MENISQSLYDAIENLPDDELDMLDKVADGSKGVVFDTENPEARKTLPTERPHSASGRLGLSVLSENSFQEQVRTYAGVDANGLGAGGTENVFGRPKKVEPGVMFEKRAQEEVIQQLYDIAGINLEKVASYETELDLLTKVASETLAEMNDLEKIASELAAITAEMFIQNLNEYM